ncbi:hypothetical protein ACFL5T_01800 [Gemmatimonadota bacterium]
MITKFEDLPGVTVLLGPTVNALDGHFYVLLKIEGTADGAVLLSRLMLTASSMMHAFGTVSMSTACGPANEPATVALRVTGCSVEAFLNVLSAMPEPAIARLLDQDPEWAIRRFHPMPHDPQDLRGTSSREKISNEKEGAR